MASRDEVTLPATRPKSRKSLASSRTMDQENMTTDFVSLASGKRGAPIGSGGRKSRSKSIGPGGLDALKDAAGNRRKSLASIPHPPPKSILKPTMPPLREIPAHKSSRKASPKKTTPQRAREAKLIDFDNDSPSSAIVTGADKLPNPFQAEGSAAVNETRVTLRTEEEQQAAARERDEKERLELEKEVTSRRDARRKSLANRRVSFAPEATLHTWDVVVEYQDSTTSSSGTRRASSASAGTAESLLPTTPRTSGSDAFEPPSTPGQEEDETATATPEHQRNLHQKKRRRSSVIPPMNFNNPDDEFMSSSPFSGDSVDDEEVIEDDGSNGDSGDDEDDGTTMMSLDGGETTDMSMASVKSASSTGSNTRLDEALREAARLAGTQGIEFDEYGAQESEDDEVVASFAPWSKKNTAQIIESRADQENVNPFIQSSKATPLPQDEEQPEEEEMTMDMTSAIGGILPSRKSFEEDDDLSMDVTRAFGNIISEEAPKASGTARKFATSNRRQSSRRKSVESSMADETMEFTLAVGGIQAAKYNAPNQEDEDMTMEFTTVVGGVLSQPNPPIQGRRRPSNGTQIRQLASRESLSSIVDDETMDMTVAMGGIMPSILQNFPEGEDETMGMEMTTAIGSILQPLQSTESRIRAKKVMELETNLGSSPFHAEALSKSPPKSLAPPHTIASETGSPSFVAFKGRGLRRSTEARTSTTPRSRLSGVGTPVKKPATPSKQLTPQPQRPTTPGKTPPSKNVVMRVSSPKRLFKDEIKAASTPQSTKINNSLTPNRLFQQNKATGVATPSFILTPKQRRSSGIGLDRAGLGSPRVTAILDRRRSIGEQARLFALSEPKDQLNGVRFEDPRIMENEIDDERAQEQAREDGRTIFEREVDQREEEKDATINLKDLIQSLTPKRKPLKGRKSLHVGAAKGVLGKRPAELDEDEDDEDEGGVKRLKGLQGSPVKNVRLQAPPSKAETTGRMTRAARKSLEQGGTSVITPSTSSPSKNKATTPLPKGRFKDAEVAVPNARILPLAEKAPSDDPQFEEQSMEDDRIQLQDFLNLTSIRFMELTTTKRRHTIAPRSSTRDFANDTPASLEDCVAAGAATIPMLELFQHACTELKTYISEGRKTVREIESETFEENPPLFREYISATPDMKVFMDGQLKNVKTHARLLSKSTWYDWRMTLLGTLKEGLFRSAEGMIQDEERLDEQQALIETVLPQLIQQADNLQQEETDYQLAAEALASCDPEKLGNARQKLITVDADVTAKKQLIAALQKQLHGKEAGIRAGTERKQVYLDEIREAERIREECRGWNSTEISVLKDKVDVIERIHGWIITGVSGSTISMTYKKEIELVFDASSFLSKNPSVKQRRNSRVDLWYIGSNRELNPLPLTPEKEFFLQAIRDHARGLPQAQTPVKDLLSAVSSSWNKAVGVVDNIRHLNISCPTEITKTSDSSIAIQSTLLITPLATKVQIAINLESNSGKGGIEVKILPSATVAYGERFNEARMGEFLLKRLGEFIEEKGNSAAPAWGDALEELGERLLARGRKE